MGKSKRRKGSEEDEGKRVREGVGCSEGGKVSSTSESGSSDDDKREEKEKKKMDCTRRRGKGSILWGMEICTCLMARIRVDEIG